MPATMSSRRAEILGVVRRNERNANYTGLFSHGGIRPSGPTEGRPQGMLGLFRPIRFRPLRRKDERANMPKDVRR